MTETAPEFTLARWATPQEAPFAAPVFMFDADDLPPDLSGISVVLRTGGADTRPRTGHPQGRPRAPRRRRAEG